MQVLDEDGKFITVELNGDVYMRLGCKGIKDAAQGIGVEGRDYNWYRMVMAGWITADPKELEGPYQELLKGTTQ
jgi:hypothetical protein